MFFKRRFQISSARVVFDETFSKNTSFSRENIVFFHLGVLNAKTFQSWNTDMPNLNTILPPMSSATGPECHNEGAPGCLM